MPRKKSTVNNLTTSSVEVSGPIVPVIPGVEPTSLADASARSKLAYSKILPALSSCVIRNDQDYQDADDLLSRLTLGEKETEDVLEPIIRPIRKGLDTLYALNRDLLSPWKAAREKVKGLMSDYKREETRKRDEEARRILRQQEEARRKIEAATPPNQPVPNVSILTPITAAPVRAAHSSTREVQRVKVIDFEAFTLSVISDDSIPLELLQVNQKMLEEWVKANPDLWNKLLAGVEVYTDVVIASR